MADEKTSRVVQLWPTELKDKANEVAGKGKLTELTIEAVEIHLGLSGDLDARTKELNEVKYFAQQLADQLVLGVQSPEERLQALMEVEFPEWVDTTGWPANFADRVRPEPLVATDAEVLEVAGQNAERWSGALDKLAEAEKVEERVEAPVVQTPVQVEAIRDLATAATSEKAKVLIEAAADVQVESEDEFFAKKVGRDDLFAKIMDKTGGKLDDVPGLKLASDLPTPAPKDEATPAEDEATPEEVATPEVPVAHRCPACGDELIDGECWTCG